MDGVNDHAGYCRGALAAFFFVPSLLARRGTLYFITPEYIITTTISTLYYYGDPLLTGVI